MIIHQAKVSFLIIIMFFIIFRAYSVSSENNKCRGSCDNSNFPNLPFPFGFSPGCPIRLSCDSSDSGFRIGEFMVLNITSSDIIVEVPAKCNRSVDSFHALFGEHYAPSAANNILLQNCTQFTKAACEIRPTFLESSFATNPCVAKSGNISCFPGGDDGMFLDFHALNATRCRFLFSSISIVVDSAKNSSVSMELERVKLKWWVKDCNCDKNANHTVVKNGTATVGCNCICNEGYEGDGFNGGQGCKKASGCNAAKFLSGKCGGATKVGILVGGIVVGALLMGGLALLCCYIRRRTNFSSKQMSAKRLLCEAAGNSSVPFYPYKEIEKATSSFSDEKRLGTGAYGTVYAGKLHDDWVAIKRFRYRDPDSIDQVMNEIKLLSSVSHPNLVRLLGCCIEEGEPILVYEFMQNGTLSQHLQRGREKGLPWTVRLTIAAETAKAISYLHSVNPPIFHRDIKSSNILLDYNYRSKVADFGLSRLGMTESSHISTAPQGTPGYLDPQYHQYFHLSDKSDVYSFGVVLVEIITALKVVDFSRPHSEVNLASLANDRIGRGCVDEIIDPQLDLHRDAWTLSSIHNVAELAFRCLAFHRDMRPSMTEVAEELEQIRLSAWVPGMCIESPTASFCSSPDNISERSLSIIKTVKKSMFESRRLIMKQKGAADCLTSLEEVKNSSPVSVQDHWLSDQSSPSANSLLGNASQRE